MKSRKSLDKPEVSRYNCLHQMGTIKRVKPSHCWIFKCSWRATSLRLRIESDDLEYAYRRAENMVLRMEGGARCEEVKCERQVY